MKDLKPGCLAARLSYHRFRANQVRLLHVAAYWLLDTVRRWLIAARVALMTVETVRLCLLKVRGWVREWHRQVSLHLASSQPSEAWSRALAHLRLHAP